MPQHCDMEASVSILSNQFSSWINNIKSLHGWRLESEILSSLYLWPILHVDVNLSVTKTGPEKQYLPILDQRFWFYHLLNSTPSL